MKKDLLILMHLFFMVGCAAPTIDVGITAMPATETRVATSAAMEHPTEMVIAATLAATVVPSATVRVQEPLSEEGSWHVFYEGEYLYATNADGSGYLSIPVYNSNFHFQYDVSVSSQYDLMSIVDDTKNAALIYIYELPSGDLVRKIDLYVCPSDTPECEFHLWANAGRHEWSPNGRFLAFSAARGGLDSDLYVYDAEMDETSQLTQGDNNIGDFFWSPDSQWVVFKEIINGPPVWIWTAKVDGSAVNWLARTTGDRGGTLHLLAWVDDAQFIVWRQSHGGGNELRLIDVQEGFISYLFEGYFWDDETMIAFNPVDDVIALHSIDEEWSITYLYLISLYQKTPYRTDLFGFDGIFWDPVSSDFIALGYECITVDGGPGDAYAFNIDGKKECVVAPEEPVEERVDYIVVGGGK